MSDEPTLTPDPPAAAGATTTASEVPASAGSGPALPGLPAVKSYSKHLVLVYVCLGLILAGAIAAFAVLVVKPNVETKTVWSTWKPQDAGTAAMTKEIADHVAPRYRLKERGPQLVAVLSDGPTVTSGTSKVQIKAVAVRRAPQSNEGIRIVGAEKSRFYTLCGLGNNCSIEGGTPSATRGRLVRREALETALYTFKYVPAVDSVLAFMPPPPGETTTSVIFLEKSAFKEQLDQPLNKTLVLATPPLPDAEDLAEAATIDKLTLKSIFSYELTALPTGGAAIVLDPAS
jgi:hypothetical protein